MIIFDFWNKDGVLNLKPRIDLNILRLKNYNLIKITDPKWIKKKDIISVNTRVFKINKNYDKFETTDEKHKMRYFQLNKIKNQLKRHNFKFMGWYEMGKKSVLNKCWSILVVAKKIK